MVINIPKYTNAEMRKDPNTEMFKWSKSTKNCPVDREKAKNMSTVILRVVRGDLKYQKK